MEQEWILYMIECLLNENPMIISRDNYLIEIMDNISELYKVNFNESINKKNLKNSLKYFFKFITPPRSYKSSFILKNNDKVSNKTIELLRSYEQPVQRTPEWYKFRHNLITASNAWKALEEGKILDSFIWEKCQPLIMDSSKKLLQSGPLYWGTLFEPVSVMLYEKYYETKIEDFGCIKDIEHDFLGASPDGINVGNNDRFGRMLEIKNPFNRLITGIPKKEYWIQMQLQMSICKLNECDFLETRFCEYESYEHFINDGNFIRTNDGKQKGIIMSFLLNDELIYEYMPLDKTKEDYEIWEFNIYKKYEEKGAEWIKNIYWYLDQWNCILVLRNKDWFKHVVPILCKTWNIILKERNTGCSHREPKKRNKNNIIKTGCLLNNDGTIKNIIKSN